MRQRLAIVVLFLVGSVFLDSSVQAAEKKRLVGISKAQQQLYQTSSAIGDVAGHEIVQSSQISGNAADHPDWRNMVQKSFIQFDQTNGTGSHRGHGENLHENGDRNYYSFQGTHKTVLKDGGGWEQNSEGSYTLTSGTGKFKNMTGGGTYTCKFTPDGGGCNWQGDHEY